MSSVGHDQLASLLAFHEQGALSPPWQATHDCHPHIEIEYRLPVPASSSAWSRELVGQRAHWVVSKAVRSSRHMKGPLYLSRPKLARPLATVLTCRSSRHSRR